MNIDFIVKFIKEQIDGSSPAQFQTMIYRDGGVEIAPGEIAPAIIPQWLADWNVNITIDGQEKVITIHNALNNGDAVVVGKYSGVLPKYVILCKAN